MGMYQMFAGLKGKGMFKELGNLPHKTKRKFSKSSRKSKKHKVSDILKKARNRRMSSENLMINYKA